MRLIKATTALGLILSLAAGVSAQQVNNTPPVLPANNQTKLDVTPAGTPIVNIATPRADGTSYNVFTRLNAGKEGVIFNNSPQLGNSVLGGQILGNPNLIKSGTSASLILNEVTGGTRSDLAGPIEIFGPRAGIVIANPSGITCDGCGFFNVSRVSLASGRIVFGADGAFSGFAVDGGDVQIKGQGLLAGNVDYFDIISASTTINASLYARDLVIAGGASDFNYADRTATARAGGNNQLAIDSSLLGGMYANRIRLIGTGAGVGVNLQGIVTALEGPLEITTDGNIAVRSAVASGDATLKSSGGKIHIDERLYAGGSATLTAAGDISQVGDFVGAAGDIALKSGGAVTLGGSGLYAGLSADGKLSQPGAISITAAGAITAPALQAIATKAIDASADSITLGGATVLSGKSIALTAANGLDVAGSLESQADLSAKADVLNLSGTANASNALSLTARNMTISGTAVGLGSANAAATGNIAIGNAGSLQTNGAVALSGQTIDNQGRVLGVTGASVTVTGSLNNSGALLTGGDLGVSVAGDATIDGSVSANGKADVTIGGSGAFGQIRQPDRNDFQQRQFDRDIGDEH
jgi:filamentous hemagglutinin